MTNTAKVTAQSLAERAEEDGYRINVTLDLEGDEFADPGGSSVALAESYTCTFGCVQDRLGRVVLETEHGTFVVPADHEFTQILW